jgi:diacylglycerol diphosphate phosphatase/phosphatidate phosphatase
MLNGVKITQDVPLSLWTVDVCTQTDKSVLQDGMRSFPSGHASSTYRTSQISSMNNRFPSLPRKMKIDQCIMPICLAAFAGLFYLSLWMAGKMHIFDRRGYSIKGVILIIPIMGKRLNVSQKVRLHNDPLPPLFSDVFLPGFPCYKQVHFSLPSRASGIIVTVAST